MTNELSIQGLIHHFENRVRQLDHDHAMDAAGKEPHFPQLVVYLGADAARAHTTLSSSLLNTWPAFHQELKFIGAEADGGSLRFTIYSPMEDASIPATEEDVQNLVSSLFDVKMHFADKSKHIIYYLLDTTSFCSGQDFLDWMPLVARIRSLISPDPINLLDMLVLLLNANLTRRKIAGQIRNILSKFKDPADPISQAVSNVLLVSNLLSNHAILADWEPVYGIIAAAICMSNNSNHHIAGSFFSHSILTPAYARVEKPLGQIGQVVSKKLLTELQKHAPKVEVNPLQDPRLREKLGMTPDGNFAMLDDYAEHTLCPLLPSDEALEFFPRQDMSFQGWLYELSARDFDHYTMGAWKQYLQDILNTAREKLALDATLRKSWIERYCQQLKSAFSMDELRYLAHHPSDVREIMSAARQPSEEAPVLTAARDQLKYLLSADPTIIGLFLEALAQQGRNVSEFSKTWAALLNSLKLLYFVRDESIVSFYERKVQDYFDHHGSKVGSEFAAIQDSKALTAFLQKQLEKIIDSDEVFHMSFEDELETRLNQDSMTIDAKQYARSKLTGDEVYTYLQTHFGLGHPVASAILLKSGTKLHGNLKDNLSPDTYYYNTGNSNAAEALLLYEVGKNNLLTGEEI